jgi:hypothetical protein
VTQKLVDPEEFHASTGCKNDHEKEGPVDFQAKNRPIITWK